MLIAFALDAASGTSSHVLRNDPISIAISIAISAALYVAGYVIQKLTKPKPGEQQRQDIRIVTANEGAPIPRIYGTFAVGAKIIARGSVTTRREGTGGGKRQGTNFETKYSVSLGALVCENIDGNILGISRIWYNGNVLYQRDPTLLDGTNPAVMGDPTGLNAYHIQEYGFAQAFQILLGQESQTDRCDWFSPSGEFAEPAYRGYVTIWWRDMDLTAAYNQIPQILVECVCADQTIAEIYARECGLAGLSAGQITNGAPADGPPGCFVDGPVPPKQLFESLSLWSPFAVAEVDGKLKSFPIPQSSSTTVADGELGAIAAGRDDQGEKPVKFSLSAEQPIEIPQRVEVTYFDPDRAYEQASAGYARQYGAARGVQQIFVPFQTTRYGAQLIASQALSRMWTERDALAISLPPKYIKYHPGDTLTIPAPNTQSFDMRISTMEFAPGDVCKIEGVRQIRLQGLGASPGDVVGEPPNPTNVGAGGGYIQSVMVISNCPPLIDDHDQFDGIYWGAGPQVPTGVNPPTVWAAAHLYRNACGSDDTFKVYQQVASTVTAAVIGKAKSVLASATGLDVTNTVDVDFPYGLGTNTVVGTLDAAFTNSLTVNLTILGKEVIQWRDVISDVSATYSLPAGRVFRLGGKIKRGLKDTVGQVGTHAVDEPFMLWNPDSVIRVPININEHLQDHNYKTLTKGMEEAQVNNPLTVQVDPETPFTTIREHVAP